MLLLLRHTAVSQAVHKPTHQQPLSEEPGAERFSTLGLVVAVVLRKLHTGETEQAVYWVMAQCTAPWLVWFHSWHNTMYARSPAPTTATAADAEGGTTAQHLD